MKYNYPNYLIHYNKNHSKSNGQFTSGDGDGDGIANDHAHQKKTDRSIPSRAQSRKTRNSGIRTLAIGAGLSAASTITSRLNKGVKDVTGDSSLILSGASMVTAIAAIPVVATGLTKTIGGAVNMGKASRRGDLS